MKLEQAIHARWASASPLQALLPADRLRTGACHGVTIPYAVVTRKASSSLVRTNTGDVFDQATVVIDVWHDDYDAGRAIAQQARKTFDRCGFALADGGRVRVMQWSGETVSRHERDVWQFTLEFVVHVYLPSGA